VDILEGVMGMVEGKGRGGKRRREGGFFLLPPHLSFSALWHPSLPRSPPNTSAFYRPHPSSDTFYVFTHLHLRKGNSCKAVRDNVGVI
jgi:hypothetical protein